MTYTPEQARAMARAAVRWARDMWEASEEAIVARVLKDVGPQVAAAGPALPPGIRPGVLRLVASFLHAQADTSRAGAEELRDLVRNPEALLEIAGVYQALAEWLEQEADRREQAGCAAKVEILHACIPDEAWASQEEDGSRG